MSRRRWLLFTIVLTTVCVIFVFKKVLAGHANGFNEYLDYVAENKTKRILFIESSGKRYLNARQACSIESASRHHKNTGITLYTTNSHGFFQNDSYASIVQNLTNLRIDYMDVNSATKGTPLEKWVSSDQWKTSSFVTEHSSDIMRYALLWKNGGIYLDLDTIVMRDMSNLTNCAARDAESQITNAVLVFEPKHEILSKIIEEVPKMWNGEVFAAIGPKLITSVFKSVCREDNLDLVTPAKCYGAKLLPSKAFYLVPWQDWAYLFQSNWTDQLLDEIVKERSFLVHYYNKISRHMKIKFNTYSLIEVLAKNHCPAVFEESMKQGIF